MTRTDTSNGPAILNGLLSVQIHEELAGLGVTPRAARLLQMAALRQGRLPDALPGVPKAVLAAGVDPTRFQRVVPWNRDRVIEAILTRALRNESLAPRHVEPRSLAEAGQRLFGSWSAAVTAAGLDPKVVLSPPARLSGPRLPQVRTPRRKPAHQPLRFWTRELVIAAIRTRLREGKRMNAWSVTREDGGLYRAARRYLKNWRNALRASGLDPDACCVLPRRKDQSAVARMGEPVTRESQAKDGMRPEGPA